jgi:hypothetical protein
MSGNTRWCWPLTAGARQAEAEVADTERGTPGEPLNSVT